MGGHDHGHGEGARRIWIFLASILASTILVAEVLNRIAEGIPLGFIIPVVEEEATVASLLYHLVVLGAGVYVGYLGLRELLVERRFSVEFLMSVAAAGAWYLDLLFEGATVLLLYSLAEYFETYIEDRARKAVEALSRYIPDEAVVVEGSSERRMRVDEVMPGSVVLVRPGERIPLDGVVLEGGSQVDESIVTGESIPVFKRRGDQVYAGTLNLDGVLRIRVTKPAEETLVSKIVELVLESRKRKASIERLIDRFARFYVPAVVAASAFTAAAMPAITGDPYTVWLYRALVLLVVSCPSAFIVSVPATMFTAIAVMARRGVIIKGGAYIERARDVRVVVFDKTGTLTLGAPKVETVRVAAGVREDEVLLYAAAVESYSNHPVSAAILRAADERRLEYRRLKVEEFREIPGRGVVGWINGRRVIVGSEELLREYEVKVDGGLLKDTDGGPGMRAYVAFDDRLVAEIRLADEVREDAVRAVDELRRDGVQVVMLTGDKEEIARGIAEKLGISEFYAQLLPEDKLRIVEELRSRYGRVAMVGDGINDAPALAAADVGIAMGGAGVDVSLEAADIVLVKDEISKVPEILRLSRKAVVIAKQNIAASLGVKLALGALGFIGLVPLWMAVAVGDDGVTLLLLGNVFRLTRT